jgi:hypothetical protein
VGGGAVTAWGALRARLPDLAAKMRDLRPPKLRVVVDGQVVYGALVVPEEGDLEAHSARFGGPSRLEGWLLERLALLEERFPGAREVELLGVWAGNPPRLEVIARVRPRSPSP